MDNTNSTSVQGNNSIKNHSKNQIVTYIPQQKLPLLKFITSNNIIKHLNPQYKKVKQITQSLNSNHFNLFPVLKDSINNSNKDFNSLIQTKKINQMAFRYPYLAQNTLTADNFISNDSNHKINPTQRTLLDSSNIYNYEPQLTTEYPQQTHFLTHQSKPHNSAFTRYPKTNHNNSINMDPYFTPIQHTYQNHYDQHSDMASTIPEYLEINMIISIN